ncbi:glycosyltransferase family 4 protein, partial [Patescibacteria group bacterium]|nr:glycosyltransferase family 4 protein [Patescibacteria group bacterium]
VSPSPLLSSHRKRRFVIAGRMTPLKNIIPTLKILSEIRTDVDDFGVLIVGEGPQRKEIVKWIQENEFGGWIKTQRNMHHGSLMFEVALSFCVVQLSWAEVSPNLALEALSLGTPVILTSENGLADDLKSYAIMVSPIDHNAVSSAFREILTKEGYTRVLEKASKFSWPQTTETMMDQYEKLFLSLER